MKTLYTALVAFAFAAAIAAPASAEDQLPLAQKSGCTA
jgi:hypothetical protein